MLPHITSQGFWLLKHCLDYCFKLSVLILPREVLQSKRSNLRIKEALYLCVILQIISCI